MEIISDIDKEWDLNSRLSANFTLREMLFGTNDMFLKMLSKEDQIIFLKAVKNSLTQQVIRELEKLCLILEIIRAYLEEPVFVTCGYRPYSWEIHRNRSGKSRHVKGQAADITFKQASLQYVYDWIVKNIRIGGRGLNLAAKFIHVDTRPNFAEWGY